MGRGCGALDLVVLARGGALVRSAAAGPWGWAGPVVCCDVRRERDPGDDGGATLGWEVELGCADDSAGSVGKASGDAERPLVVVGAVVCDGATVSPATSVAIATTPAIRTPAKTFFEGERVG